MKEDLMEADNDVKVFEALFGHLPERRKAGKLMSAGIFCFAAIVFVAAWLYKVAAWLMK